MVLSTRRGIDTGELSQCKGTSAYQQECNDWTIDQRHRTALRDGKSDSPGEAKEAIADRPAGGDGLQVGHLTGPFGLNSKASELDLTDDSFGRGWLCGTRQGNTSKWRGPRGKHEGSLTSLDV